MATFLQLFSEMHGEKLAAQRFNTVYNSAVTDNQTIKAIVAEIEWEHRTTLDITKKLKVTVATVDEEF